MIAPGFLGLELSPPNPSWGSDLADVLNYAEAPFATEIAGVVLVVAPFSSSRIEDAIRALVHAR